ncbi:exopolysaccharide biosynthesis polyprenyl glycosylphosphotransferase [Streptomyces spinoverrucosus]|uniref:exopolysaccharide biosynthesis polyprenyl glycosylphosphotransferase n=1 Tax=Streptomyces spinoverrucosus TaxID=284043 RepID=UPI0018C3913E|nr:exopolysaccharide biosynthesis polyprenyl glycosylphosphotransferase [Streptomyces spinoverrucosus]MBG0855160.1 exopolysaccharide biosynthesis polyprenyl glycosylphosphotransferase [Streptomyces spinoverrucosus]
MTAERTAESTVPSPGTQPRDHGFPTVPVVHATGRGGAGFRSPARRPAARPASPVSLLGADLGAALLGALTLSRPVLMALLVAGAMLLRPHRPPRRGQGVLDELPTVCGRIAVAWLALAALVAAHDPRDALPAGTLALGFTVHATAGCAGRGLVHWRRRVALLRQPRAALVVGPVDTAQRVAAAVLRHPRCGVRPVGIVADHPDGTEGLPVLTTGEEVHRALIQNGVRDVLVVHPSVRTEHGPLLRALAESGCAVWELDADSPSCEAREQLAGYACRQLELGSGRRVDVGKRVLDAVVSGALLLAVSPLLLACALALRISEGPGVVFRQERIGQDGRPFTLLKLRTHRPADEHESATRWSVENEHDMPWFCRFLRRTSLDELLQLWNVFRGDMSLVGPRPERPYFVDRFSQTHPGYAARHRMPTGITGLAQINGLRGDTSIEDRARFDNAYIDNWSLWQDVCILLRTAVALVRPTGS